MKFNTPKAKPAITPSAMLSDHSTSPHFLQSARESLMGILQNTGWMMISEASARASRLLTIIVLASMLSASDYGIAMLALVCHELVRLLTRVGAGARIVQCNDEECGVFAANCYTLNWIVSIAIAASQYCLAPVLADYYAAPQLTPLLQYMAISYLIYPLVAIKVALLQRNNHFKHIGLVSALAISSDNLATALLALSGLGLMSVAYAKVIAAIVWYLGFYNANVTAYKPRFDRKQIVTLLKFSLPVLLSDGLKTLRGQIDVLIAARLLAPELFGLYSFAKSAGIGFAISLNHAFATAIYPRLCVYYREDNLSKGLKLVTCVGVAICFLFLTQAALAPIYVPMLFNNDFANAGSLVATLCLCAIPLLLIDIVAMGLRVQFQLGAEMFNQMVLVVGLLLALVMIKPISAEQFAQVTVITSYAALPISYLIYRICTFNMSNTLPNSIGIRSMRLSK